MKVCKICGINIKNPNIYCSKKCYAEDKVKNWPKWSFHITPEIHEAIEGILLSDGSLSFGGGNYYPRFMLTQGTGHREYCEYFAELFGFSKDRVIYLPKYSNKTGKTYDSYCFSTPSSPMLTEYYNRWYPNGKKIIPPDFKVTPISMLHEYLGDGCLSSYFSNKARNHYFRIQLHTQSFLKESNISLIVKPLNDLGIDIKYYEGKSTNKGSYNNTLIIHSQSDINKFLEYLPSNPISCYNYKFDTLPVLHVL